MIVAETDEPPPGEPLFVKLVENGRVIYNESFPEQARRADRTWQKYQRWVLSPRVEATMSRFRAMREREVEAARARESVQ